MDEGILFLDSNVNNTLKTWKVPDNEFTKDQKVTLRRLIGHTSGIKNYLWSSYLPTEHIPTIKQMLEGEKPSIDPPVVINYQPGTMHSYSNPGYTVLQELMMEATNQSFEKIINDIVFIPCGMHSSTFRQPLPATLMIHKAIGYTKDRKPYPYKLFPFQSAGGIWTTPSDLGKFMIAILKDYHKGSNILVSKKTADQIFSKDAETLSFSKWYSGHDVVFRHTGSNQGFNCFMFGSVDHNQGIVVMTNVENSFELFDFIMRAVAQEYKWEYFRPEVFDTVELDKSKLERYIGKYNWDGDTISIKNDSNHLAMIWNGKKEQQALSSVGENTFLLPSAPLKIIFPPDDPAKAVIFKSNGDYSEAIKIQP